MKNCVPLASSGNQVRVGDVELQHWDEAKVGAGFRAGYKVFSGWALRKGSKPAGLC